MDKYSGKIFLLTFCKKNTKLLLIYRLSVNIHSKLYFVCEKEWLLTYYKYMNNDVLKYTSKATVGIVQQIH